MNVSRMRDECAKTGTGDSVLPAHVKYSIAPENGYAGGRSLCDARLQFTVFEETVISLGAEDHVVEQA